MGIGVSIFLVASGAVLSWGVEQNPSGFNLDNIGLILMLVGGLGLLISLLLFEDWQPWGRTRRDFVDADVVTRRRVLPTEEVVHSEPIVRRDYVQEPAVRRRVSSSQHTSRG